MRIIGRTLIILAAALAVAGVVWALAGSGSAAASGMPGGGMEHGGEQGASLFGAIEVLKNLVVVGVIVGLTSLASRLKSRRRPAAA